MSSRPITPSACQHCNPKEQPMPASVLYQVLDPQSYPASSVFVSRHDAQASAETQARRYVPADVVLTWHDQDHDGYEPSDHVYRWLVGNDPTTGAPVDCPAYTVVSVRIRDDYRTDRDDPPART